MTLRIGIYAFDDVEVLDLAGPYEVFTTAARLQARGHDATPRLEVVLIASTSGPVRSRPGMALIAPHALRDAPPLDVLLVPGGVVEAELDRSEVLDWIAATSAHARIVASVCTGAFLLAAAGLLEGREATTHWEDLDELRARFPRVLVRDDARWIDTGHIVTSAGISAGIDMSLHLVRRLCGEELAQATARQMDYAWQDSGVSHRESARAS
ncbi:MULTISPECIES: DJ-1/PfpI family protein [Pseudoxanthomonas]|uniref:Transcriptional regulator GlxA family with amidase domain n=1 Tax=Pseudoxanthomonas winnipegensis TaxID=2480810 RepID=A0AAW8GFK0_9GAMM|nr:MULTISPECIES: DJ-1/PfpI family protein [Pseudoxanthomonas]MDQ1120950.1 transcriptional regulator GlxA family with amidase domain [Pseudoxanthomonas winnipegensis]MDQ1134179.1 transcriptional regulator GlxA family with amidase domain [Pseudoxanthomonas winnipegensis]MDR6139584.1 transcriptional regulator GlxA family with amidase domain [Pseudoxanthomonas sp. SORGH_AS_0997]